MIVGVVIQQPADRLDWDISFTEFLNENDTLESVGVSSSPDGLTVQAIISGTQLVKVWISGGVVDEIYKIEVTANTVGGRSKQVELEVHIKEF